MNGVAAILIDTTLCTGCEKCVVACKQENGLGKDRPRRGQRAVDALSPTRFCTILRRPKRRFVRQQCRHCLEPACVSACPVGALQKTPEGAVTYDADKCMGCRYCLMACPYGIPRYDWNEAVPFVRKCNLCYDRLTRGKAPACVESCPEEAAIFGNRQQMLREAHRRLRANPRTYVQRVYGEHEVGGTSVLYISDVSLDLLAWQPELGERPLPQRTWASLAKVPPVILAMGGLMAGIHWIIRRRMLLAGQAGLADRPQNSGSATAPAEQESGDNDD